MNNNFSEMRFFTIILLLEKREHSFRTSWLDALDVILQTVRSPNCSTCGIEGVSRENEDNDTLLQDSLKGFR